MWPTRKDTPALSMMCLTSRERRVAVDTANGIAVSASMNVTIDLVLLHHFAASIT